MKRVYWVLQIIWNIVRSDLILRYTVTKVAKTNLNGSELRLVRCRNPWGLHLLNNLDFVFSWIENIFSSFKEIKLNGMALGVTPVPNGTYYIKIKNSIFQRAVTANFGKFDRFHFIFLYSFWKKGNNSF